MTPLVWYHEGAEGAMRTCPNQGAALIRYAITRTRLGPHGSLSKSYAARRVLCLVWPQKGGIR